MKLMVLSIITGIAFLFFGCANTTRFPVSSIVPAADIKAKTKVDKNNNKLVIVNAKNLASPERIDPSSNAYVIWGRSESDDIRNLGQLQNKNAGTASLTAITPFDLEELIITAEPSGNVMSPSGTEISRVELDDPFTEEPLLPVDDTYSPSETPAQDEQYSPSESPTPTEQDPFRSPYDTTGVR